MQDTPAQGGVDKRRLFQVKIQNQHIKTFESTEQEDLNSIPSKHHMDLFAE